MLKKLQLERFKNFKKAELNLDHFTLLLGTNASGKSNIREAFRFLHGISRGYTIAEVLGEKWGEGGVIQWHGIRGGTREVAFCGGSTFAISATLTINAEAKEYEANYRIEVAPDSKVYIPRIISEYLSISEPLISEDKKVFKFDETIQDQGIAYSLDIFNIETYQKIEEPIVFSSLGSLAILPQLATSYFIPPSTRTIVQKVLSVFLSMQFLDLRPEAMRFPSVHGQTILGDRGENLSSVLQEICQVPERKQTLLSWIEELTPMDVSDLEFPADFTGKVLLHLIEKTGEKISAYSASDGTLRFLAIAAALLGTNRGKFYFFEELENGIHPSRLHLLLQLISQTVFNANIQIITTTHSPQLLRLLSPKSLEAASFTYRLPDRVDAGIKRILDIPEARQVLEKQDIARLHDSGWLEDAMYFLEDEEIAE
jgi:predicted ATPase